MNIWIWLVTKIQIYRRVLGIYILWDLRTSSQQGQGKVCLTWNSWLWGSHQVSMIYPNFDSQSDQWLVAWLLNFFFLLHSSDLPATTWCASFICHIKTVPASTVFAFSYIPTDLLCFVLWYWTWRCLHSIGHHHFLLHFSSLVIQNYFLTMLPLLHLVWSKIEAHPCRALSMFHRTPLCYCFPSEPPSSSRLPTTVSTSNCKVRLPWSKEETTLQPLPRASLSLPAPGDFKEAPNTSSQQHTMIHGKVHAKANLAPTPPGYVQSLPSIWAEDSASTAGALITILFSLPFHRRGTYRHMQEYGLYELYTKALKVTHKKNKVAFKDRYFKLHIVLAKSSFPNMALPLCGFLILIDPFTSGLSLLYLPLSHLPSSNFETHPVTAFPQRQTKPPQQVPTMKGDKISKNFW